MQRNKNIFILHLALWLPLFFTTPFIILLKNPDDFKLGFLSYVAVLLMVTTLLSLVSWFLIKITSPKIQSKAIAFLLACAIVLVVQGYVVHGLFDYGQLDGHKVHWGEFGMTYWVEFIFFILAIIILSKVLIKKAHHWKTIAAVLIIFSLAQAAVLIPNYLSIEYKDTKPFDDSVFEFSSSKNIIHILADGFQEDIAKQVLEENPKLAQQFTGFTFFNNHLGHFQSTAPTIPSIFNGKFFDLDKGYNTQKMDKDIEQHSYANELSDAGYRLDFAGISRIYCLDSAHSCVNKSFNDLKSRGYLQHKSTFGDFMWLTDISLFRHLPMFLKEKIYNNGLWWLSGKIARTWSPYPDPIIREWTDNMRVTTNQPMYKWHHFIGTHIPAQWNADCQFIGRQPQERAAYKAQAHCILKDMAQLFKKMKQLHIYDNSIIIINGDHGSNIPANDVFGESKNTSTYRDGFLGVTRPVFMFKRSSARGLISFNDAPTTLEDIAPTILDAAGLLHDSYIGVSAYEKPNNMINKRSFNRYITKTFWQGKPISFNEYTVSGNIRDRSNWQLVALHNRAMAPSQYDVLSYDSIFDFSMGFGLSIPNAKIQKEAAIYGKELFVLLGSEDDKEKKLSIKLKIPKRSTNQSFIITVNNQTIESNIQLQPIYNKVFLVEIKIPKGFLIKGNNLFKFKFSKAGKINKKDSISAIIRSISLN